MTARMRLVFLGLIALVVFIGMTALIMLMNRPAALVSPGGDFALVDQDGRAVTAADFRGRHMLVFFGFTNCPDVCPMSLQRIAEALDAAPELLERLTPVLVSVDPERDTPGRMKEYLAYFGPAFRGLTGTPAQIDAMVKAYRVYARRVPLEDSALGYTMDHSGLIYLYDPQGEFVRTYDPSIESAALADALKADTAPAKN